VISKAADEGGGKGRSQKAVARTHLNLGEGSGERSQGVARQRHVRGWPSKAQCEAKSSVYLVPCGLEWTSGFEARFEHIVGPQPAAITSSGGASRQAGGRGASKALGRR
jgi:hypothetical protein